MPEGLITSDGKPVNLDQEFARAMAQPDSQEPTAQKPPRKDGSDNVQTTPRKPRTRRDAPRVEKPAPKPKPSTLSPEALAKQRSDGIKGVVQMSAVVPLMMYQRTGNKAFMADTVTLTRNADALADACVQTAAVSPTFAKLLDQVTNVGPYAALVGVTVSITAQLAANHGVAIGRALGASDPADLIAEFEAENEKASDASNPSGAV